MIGRSCYTNIETDQPRRHQVTKPTKKSWCSLCLRAFVVNQRPASNLIRPRTLFCIQYLVLPPDGLMTHLAR